MCGNYLRMVIEAGEEGGREDCKVLPTCSVNVGLRGKGFMKEHIL